MTIGTCILANIIAKTKYLKVIYFDTSNSNKQDFHRLVRNSFRESLFWNFEKFKSENYNLIETITESEFSNLKITEDIYNYKYNNLYVGDILYDQHLRMGEWNATIKEINERTKKTLREVISIIEAQKEIEKKFEINHTCFSHSVGFGGLIMRYYALKNIKSTFGVVGSGPIKKFLNFNGVRNPYIGHIPSETISSIIDENNVKEKYLALAESYLTKKFSGGIDHSDSVRAFNNQKKTYLSKNEFCINFNLDNSKNCVFVMMHAFNDYPNHFKSIYKDYFEWFKSTLDICKEIKDINWIFKEHPSSEFYPVNDINLKDLFNQYENFTNIKFLDHKSNFNTKSILNIAEGIITCAGTSALEFSCFGKKSIITSECNYHSYNISYMAKNKKEYENLLINFNTLEKPSIEKSEKAKIIYYLTYGVVLDNGWNSDAFLPFSSHETRLKNNVNQVLEYYLAYISSNQNEYLARLEDFIVNENEIMFFRDQYLSELEKLPKHNYQYT